MKSSILQISVDQHEVFAACRVEWSQLKRLKVSSHVRYETTKILEKLLTEVYNGTTTLEHNSMVSYTVKHSFNSGVKKSPCHTPG